MAVHVSGRTIEAMGPTAWREESIRGPAENVATLSSDQYENLRVKQSLLQNGGILPRTQAVGGSDQYHL